jgi:hypothetical protein
MRFSFIKRTLLRRTHPPAQPAIAATTRSLKDLGRSVQDAIDWNTHNRERRKRLGLE